MFLSSEQKNYNRDQLLEMADLLTALHNDIPDVSERLKQTIIPLIIAKLNEKNLFIHLSSQMKALELMIERALRVADEIKFEQELEAWAENYRINYEKLDQVATSGMYSLAMNQPWGLTRTLMELGTVADETWGNDYDIRVVLREVIEIPETINSDGIHILPPLNLVAGAEAGQPEKEIPHLLLKNTIETVLANNPDKNMQLLIQVNCGQSHWGVAHIELQKGRITSAILWDPMHTAIADLQITPAFKNLCNAVHELTPAAKVKVVAGKVQTDFNSCMDHSTQYVLQTKFAGKPLTQKLAAIRDASSSKEVRSAVVKKIQAEKDLLKQKVEGSKKVPAKIEKLAEAPEVVEAPKVVAPKVEVAPKTEAAAKSNPSAADVPTLTPASIEKIVFSSLNPGGKTVDEVKQIKNLQIKFDALMAAKLNDLYQENPSVKSDESLLIQARFHAYEKLQHSFGFFKSTGKASSVIEATTTVKPRTL